MSDQARIDTPNWVNGQPQGCLPLSDRGLAYGDGVFETVRVTTAGPVLLDLHLRRLQSGLQGLSIALNWAQLEQEIRSYPGWSQPGIVKIIVTRGAGGRGYGSAQVSSPNRIFSVHPVPGYDPHWFQNGIQLFPCKTRLAQNPVLAGIKHLNRLEQVLARQEWDSTAYQEGLMRDQQGLVVEGVFSNIFLVHRGVVKTPDLSLCGVAGVMRRWLMEEFQRNGYTLAVAQITLQDIALADEWFFCNSVYGIWPVCRLEDRVWPVGKVTRTAQHWVANHWQL